MQQLCAGVLLQGNSLNQDSVQAIHLEHWELVALLETADMGRVGEDEFTTVAQCLLSNNIHPMPYCQYIANVWVFEASFLCIGSWPQKPTYLLSAWEGMKQQCCFGWREAVRSQNKQLKQIPGL